MLSVPSSPKSGAALFSTSVSSNTLTSIMSILGKPSKLASISSCNEGRRKAFPNHFKLTQTSSNKNEQKIKNRHFPTSKFKNGCPAQSNTKDSTLPQKADQNTSPESTLSGSENEINSGHTDCTPISRDGSMSSGKVILLESHFFLLSEQLTKSSDDLIILQMFQQPILDPKENTGVGCHFPPPKDLPESGVEPTSPTWAGGAPLTQGREEHRTSWVVGEAGGSRQQCLLTRAWGLPGKFTRSHSRPVVPDSSYRSLQREIVSVRLRRFWCGGRSGSEVKEDGPKCAWHNKRGEGGGDNTQIVCVPSHAMSLFCPDGASAGVEKGSGRELNSTVLSNLPLCIRNPLGGAGLPAASVTNLHLTHSVSKSQDRKSASREKRSVVSFDEVKESRKSRDSESRRLREHSEREQSMQAELERQERKKLLIARERLAFHRHRLERERMERERLERERRRVEHERRREQERIHHEREELRRQQELRYEQERRPAVRRPYDYGRRDDAYWPEAKRAALDERYHSDFNRQDRFHDFDHRDRGRYPDHSVDRREGSRSIMGEREGQVKRHGRDSRDGWGGYGSDKRMSEGRGLPPPPRGRREWGDHGRRIEEDRAWQGAADGGMMDRDHRRWQGGERSMSGHMMNRGGMSGRGSFAPGGASRGHVIPRGGFGSRPTDAHFTRRY
ncbi:hypothetical protein FD755_000125 [Muntiacus reevesi]|uniref:Uncharacterized protein n=1 Tax=Muntiacus reevesi TaxID=9886 RepID=A0A5J5N0G5_MUNRE|nr:hypothetical protein FD755_000125 [Muntiacus reevesi]